MTTTPTARALPPLGSLEAFMLWTATHAPSELYDAFRAVAAGREKHCPCKFVAVEACSRNCTCRTPTLSGGCVRCCTYGSIEQRLAAARRLVERDAIVQELAACQPLCMNPEEFEAATCSWITRARALSAAPPDGRSEPGTGPSDPSSHERQTEPAAAEPAPTGGASPLTRDGGAAAPVGCETGDGENSPCSSPVQHPDGTQQNALRAPIEAPSDVAGREPGPSRVTHPPSAEPAAPVVCTCTDGEASIGCPAHGAAEYRRRYQEQPTPAAALDRLDGEE
jgi:hypothetical protein